MSDLPVFYQFPEEILTEIVNEVFVSVTWKGERFCPSLKAIRLSSPKFAYLRKILSLLFARAQLVATSEHVESLQHADFSRIAPFVTRVIFLPPPESWGLTFEGFKKLVNAQALDKSSHNPEQWNDLVSNVHQYDGTQTSFGTHWKNMFSISDEQLLTEFTSYHAKAVMRREFLTGAHLKLHWVQALKAMTNAHIFRFAYLPRNEHAGQDVPNPPECIIRPHHQDPNLDMDGYVNVTAPVGEALFEVGISCLAAAKKEVHKLFIKHASTGAFGWEHFESLPDLNLEHLRVLNLWPEVVFGLAETAAQSEVEANAARALSAVLEKCKNSLAKLHYKPTMDGWCMAWPGVDEKVVPLPNLRSLTLGDGKISPDRFQAWMAQMPMLVHLEMTSSRLASGYDYSDWRFVYDAIRQHPRGIKVVFDQIITNDAAEISLEYHTVDDLQAILDQQEWDDPWEDIWRSLPLYLSGKIDWNRSLEMWHE